MAADPAALKVFQVFSESLQKELELNLQEDKLVFNDPDNKENREVRCFKLDDVIGLKVHEVPAPPPRHTKDSSISSQGHNGDQCHVELCTFSFDETTLPQPSRKVKFISFYFNNGSTFNANRSTALECRGSIQDQCLRNDQKTFMYGDTTGSSEVPPTDVTPPRLLVIINPFSGRKKGVKEYHQTVQPFLDIAGIIVEELLVTERPNHAKEFVQSFDFSRITGVITVGGDGTTFEIINGIMNRPDYESVLKTPIGIIPTGSGNAVLASLLYEQNVEYSMMSAVYQIIRGGYQPTDVIKVTMATQEPVYMIHALTWGLIADLDIESEVFRFLGDKRFFVGFMRCLAQKRVYRGRLSYLPSCTGDTHRGTGGNHNDEGATNGSLEDTTGCEQTDQSSDTIDKDQTTPTSVVVDTPSGGAEPQATPTISTTPLTNGCDNDWITIEDNFLSVSVLMASKLSISSIGHPDAVLGGGELYIIYILGSTSRSKLMSIFDNASSGEYIDDDDVYVVRAKGCRIEPLTDRGRLVADGEEIEYGPVSLEYCTGNRLYLYSRKI